MKVAAIITEYNPFHNGHKYQIDKTREFLGEDTAIIAIMSGNFTQRGEIAFADKSLRARVAVECGVNLVLELPFPYSMSSAEFFAKSGVHIANSIGVVDYLVFGSECGDIDMLKKIAKNTSKKDFVDKLTEKDKEKANIGYAALYEKIYSELFKDENKLGESFFTSNNILAIEYIKAIELFNSSIIPMTIKREGGEYRSSYIEGEIYQSASAIREMICDNNDSAFDYIPNIAKIMYREAIEKSEMPQDATKLDTAIISNFRLNPPKQTCTIHDAGGGLYNRLYQNSMTESTISSLVKKTETKKYTTARIRRAVFNSFFGVTSSVVKELPYYTQVLATDAIGRSLLKKIKKTSDFSVLTKPSAYRECSDEVIRQVELSLKADSVFDLARKKPISGVLSLKYTPYVKK